MRKKDKLDNIERMKRIDEFMRLQTLQKIAADEERTKSIIKQKSDLLQQRKKMAAKQRLNKARLSSAIDRLRQTQRWDKLDSVIDEALSPGGKKKRKKRRKKKNGMGGSASAPSFSSHP